jgi:hypothetical protein
LSLFGENRALFVFFFFGATTPVAVEPGESELGDEEGAVAWE